MFSQGTCETLSDGSVYVSLYSLFGMHFYISIPLCHILSLHIIFNCSFYCKINSTCFEKSFVETLTFSNYSPDISSLDKMVTEKGYTCFKLIIF